MSGLLSDSRWNQPKKPNTDQLPAIEDSSITPPLQWTDEELDELMATRQQKLFERRSGPGQRQWDNRAVADLQTTALPVIPKSTILITLPGGTRSVYRKKHDTVIELCRCGTTEYQNTYNGYSPAGLQLSPKNHISFQEDLIAIYGQDYMGCLLFIKGGTLIPVTTDPRLDNDTVICVH